MGILARRDVLAGITVAGAGALAAGGAAFGNALDRDRVRTGVVPFDGAHQAGITTPAQDQLVFAAIDVTTTDAAELADVLARWSVAARSMTAGSAVGGGEGGLAGALGEPPADTGEAHELPASDLTVTLGYGPSLFDGRFGLQDRRPALLEDLPALPGDQLDPSRCGGDLALQACANDPQVAFHAVRNLLRIGRGVVALRWMQLGFGRTSSTAATQTTPRNLMGFKDGTANVRAEDTEDLRRWVFVGGSQTAGQAAGQAPEQDWMRDGSYLVARRIRMLVESWDRASLGEQERVIGRTKLTGAPLSSPHGAEFDRMDLTATTSAGTPAIDVAAHVRLAAPETNGGRRLLRRGYSYTDGMDPVTGQLDAGLFFLAYGNDPEGFVGIQRRLGAHDALTEYVKHTGSAVFAVPPGTSPGEVWGERLFA